MRSAAVEWHCGSIAKLPLAEVSGVPKDANEMLSMNVPAAHSMASDPPSGMTCSEPASAIIGEQATQQADKRRRQDHSIGEATRLLVLEYCANRIID